METLNILQILGISSIVTVVISFILDLIKSKNNIKFEKIMIEKENRYRSILVFMMAVLDYKNIEHIDTNYKPLEKTEEGIKNYYLNELQIHLEFLYLFSSKKVINSLDIFISTPDKNNYRQVALAMHKDLWNRKLKI